MLIGCSPSGSTGQRILASSTQRNGCSRTRVMSTPRFVRSRGSPRPGSTTQSPTLPPRVESMARRLPSGDHWGAHHPEPSEIPFVRFDGASPGARWSQTSAPALPHKVLPLVVGQRLLGADARERERAAVRRERQGPP
jgi:hypothetical protein